MNVVAGCLGRASRGPDGSQRRVQWQLRFVFQYSGLRRAVGANGCIKNAALPWPGLGAFVDRVIGRGLDIGGARGRRAEMNSFFVLPLDMRNADAPLVRHLGAQDRIQLASARLVTLLAVADLLIDQLLSARFIGEEAIVALGIIDDTAPDLVRRQDVQIGDVVGRHRIRHRSICKLMPGFDGGLGPVVPISVRPDDVTEVEQSRLDFLDQLGSGRRRLLRACASRHARCRDEAGRQTYNKLTNHDHSHAFSFPIGNQISMQASGQPVSRRK